MPSGGRQSRSAVSTTYLYSVQYMQTASVTAAQQQGAQFVLGRCATDRYAPAAGTSTDDVDAAVRAFNTEKVLQDYVRHIIYSGEYRELHLTPSLVPPVEPTEALNPFPAQSPFCAFCYLCSMGMHHQLHTRLPLSTRRHPAWDDTRAEKGKRVHGLVQGGVACVKQATT
jgi:hypothetical protein